MDFTIENFDTVPSTQNVIREKLESGSAIEEGYVAVANVQTKGRGRHGRNWQSGEGNLYCSVLLKPENAAPEKIGLVALAAGLAILHTLKPFISNKNIRIKWPNDVLVEGKKISGILIESTSGEKPTFIVGIGINIKSSPIEGSICLDEISKQNETRETVLNDILEKLSEFYRQWKNGEYESLIEAYKSYSFDKGQEISVKLPDRTHKGRYSDIDLNGNLILEKEDGSLVSITSGDVYLCD